MYLHSKLPVLFLFSLLFELKFGFVYSYLSYLLISSCFCLLKAKLGLNVFFFHIMSNWVCLCFLGDGEGSAQSLQKKKKKKRRNINIKQRQERGVGSDLLALSVDSCWCIIMLICFSCTACIDGSIFFFPQRPCTLMSQC